MVGFVHNHPDRPFVTGVMFHGQVVLGGGSDNRVKSIQTRSGHRIIFTEDESIVITDKSGNEIHLDTSGSNISITAPETMTLNCKNMNINVGENMTTSVGMNSSETIGMNSSQSIGMNATQSIGAMKMTSVLGDASVFHNCADFATDVLNILNVSTTGFFDNPNTLAAILQTLPNHYSGSSNAPITLRTCP